VKAPFSKPGAAALLAVLALTLASCGRKGPLEPPPDAATPAAGTPGTAEAPAPGAAQQSPPPPKKSFLLDPLL